MSFVGMKKSVWNTLFDYDSSRDNPKIGLLGTGIPSMIKNYEKMIAGFSSNTTWDIDQDIFTHGILNTGLCSLPNNHTLWENLHIKSSIPR